MASILIWKTDLSKAEALASILEKNDHEVQSTSNEKEALTAFSSQIIDLAITDLDIDIIQRLHGDFPLVPILVIGQSESSSKTIEIVQAGAFDFLPEPFDNEELIALTTEAVAGKEENKQFKVGSKEGPAQGLVGNSRAMGKLYRDIAKLAATPVTILVRGETGTGKELVAQALWRHGHRAHEPIVIVNCAAIPENLLESELFGFEKGSFTGATTARKGKFEQANGATLFLDEIGDMSLSLQAKMLRVLQEKCISRVGGQGEIPIDVRVIAATHQPLEKMVEAGTFREDLLYRLNVASLHLPPLRDRLGDVEVLTRHFLSQLHCELDIEGKISTQALSYLARQPWPGNVRQLQNLLRRALLKRRELVIRSEDLQKFLTDIEPTSPQESTLYELINQSLSEAEEAEEGNALRNLTSQVEEFTIREALKRAGGNQSKTARWLGITRLTLREKLKNFQ